MDLAPALPPSQDTRSVLVSSIVDLPPETPHSELTSPDGLDAFPEAPVLSDEPSIDLSFLPPASPETTLLSVGPSNRPIPPALMVSVVGLDRLSVSSGFLTSSQLIHSFNFLTQVFRSTGFASDIVQPNYSATVPIEWASGDAWKDKAIAADIQVDPVAVTPQIAQQDNSDWSAAYTQQCLPNNSQTLSAGDHYRLSLGDKTLGYVATEAHAYTLAQQLRMLIRQAAFNPSQITLYPNSDMALGSADDMIVGTPGQSLFTVDDTMAEDLGYSKEWAAVAWANNLRLALDEAPLKVGDAHRGLQRLEDASVSMAGDASWYGPYFHGRATANGEIYNQNALTVAHKSLPFGTQLEVRNLANDKTVVVRVNDRGPYVGDRILDLSKAAADCLGSDQAGVIPVEATVLKKSSQPALAVN